MRRLSSMSYQQLKQHAKERGINQRAVNLAINRNELVQLIAALPCCEIKRNRSLSPLKLSREESLGALQTLSDISNIERQQSIERSIERLP